MKYSDEIQQINGNRSRTRMRCCNAIRRNTTRKTCGADEDSKSVACYSLVLDCQDAGDTFVRNVCNYSHTDALRLPDNLNNR